MATGSTVNVAVNVTAPGLSQANKDAAQLHSSLKGAAAASQGVRVAGPVAAARQGVAAQRGESREYGAARGTVGTGAEGRDFAKQSQGLGGLVRLYATFAANLFAVTAAYGALSRAADTTNLIKGLDQLGAASGRSLGSLSKQLAAASDGAISLRDAMQATAQASAAGMSNTSILRMGEAAAKASQALGIAMPDAISRLSRGITKLEPELLDELGIFVRVDKASENYARTLGKSTASLTDFEKRQGFANAVLEQAEQKFGNIKIDANPYAKLAASLSNLTQSGLELINKVLTPILGKLADSPVGLAVAIGLVAKTLLNQALPALGEWKKGLDDAAENARQTVISTNSARAAHRANVDSIIAEATANRDLQATKTAQLKVDELNDLANQKRLSKGTIKAIPSAAIDIVNPADTKILADQTALLEKQGIALEKKLTTLKNPAAITRNTEELAAIKATTAALNEKIIAAKALDAIQGESASRFAAIGKAAADVRRADAAAAASQRINILKETSKGYDTGDISKAWKTLNEGIANARQGLDVTGTAFENNQKKMSAWNAGLTRASGAGIIAVGAISSLGSALGALAPIAAIAGIALAIMDSYFSKNSKQAAEASAAIDKLGAATVNLGSVFDDISRKDPLAQINTQTLNAKATALTEVADAAESALKKIRAQAETASWWDTLIDTAKAKIGLGLLKQSSTELSKSVEAAFKLAGNSQAAAEAAKNIKDAVGIDPTDQAALKSALNDTPEKFFELAPKIIEQMRLLGIATAQAASSGTQLDDAFKTASKTADDLLITLTPTDNLAKLGIQTIDVAKTMTKALEDPILAVSKLNEIAGDTSKLRLLSPDVAVSLSKASPQIKLLATDIAVYTTQIENLRKEEQDLLKERADINKLTPNRRKEIDVRVGQITAATNIMQPILEGSKTALQPYLNTLKNDIPNLFTKGAKAVGDSIGIGFANAALIIAKAGAAALGDTIAGTEERNRLEKQGLDVQTRQIDASLALANITEQLRFVEEERLIFDKQKRVDELTAKSGREGNISAQELKTLESDKADIKARTTALAVGKSFASKQAGISQVSAAFKSAAPEVVAGASLALPGAQAREMAQAQKAQITAQKTAADIATSIEKRKKEYDIQKDSLTVELERLNTTKTQLELRAKSALFISDQLQNEKIATEKAIEKTKVQQTQLDFQRQIQDAVDQENRATDPRARAAAQKAQAEITAKQMKQIATDREKAQQKELGYIQEKKANEAAYIKYVLANQTILMDMQTKAANLGLNIREEQLNLASNLGTYDAEILATKITALNLDKEDQRVSEAKQGLLNNYVQTLLDLNAQLKEQAEGSEEAKAIKARIALQTSAYTSAVAGEEDISKIKKGNLGIQGLINKEVAKQGKLESQIALANALRENQREITLANLSLDEQRLNNAKELNKIDEISYINSKADLETARQKSEFDKKSILDSQALAKAQDNLRIADLAAEKLGVKEPTAAQTTAQQQVTLAQSNLDTNSALYAILKKQTAEQRAHNIELAKQKDFLDNIAGFTKTLTDLFGEMGTNIGNAAGAMATLAKNTEDRAAAMAKAKPEEREELQKKQTKAQLTDITSIANANKKMFGEKTAAYKILNGIEKASSVMTMALQAKELASTISNTAKLITETIPGIYATAMKQLGPIFGPVAATAAIAAFVGSTFGGGGGTVDMTGMTAGERQTAQGTGTVTGDSTAKSESIKNSLDILNATTVEGLSYSNRMVDLLKSINDGISGVAQGVYGVVGLTSGTGFGTKEGESGFNFLGGLFGSETSKQITDSGLAIKGTFADFVKGSKNFVQAYEDVLTTSTSSFFFFKNTNQSLSTALADLDPKVSQSITKVFGNAAKAFVEAGEGLGMTAESVMSQLANIDLTRLVSLRGLKGKELEEALAATFSGMLDTAADVVFAQLKEFNKFGEGMLQTAVRVIDGLDKVNLGMQSINKSTVGSGISGMRISEWLIDAANGLGNFLDKTKNFNTKFLDETERLAPIQAALNKELARLGVSGTVTRESFKELILGFKVTSKESAKTYDDLLDLSDSVDQLATASETAAKKVEDAAKSLAASKLDQQIKIYGLLGNAEEALKLTRQKELDALDAALKPGQLYINALEDENSLKSKLTAAYTAESTAIKGTITSLKNSIKSLKDYKTALTVGASSTLTPAQRYAQTRKALLDTAAAARTVITSTSTIEEIAARDQAISQLSGTSDTFLASSRELFASSEQYTQDFASVLDILDSTSGSLLAQETMAEKQLDALDASVATLDLIKISTESTAGLLTQLLAAQAASEIAKQAYETANSLTLATTVTTAAETLALATAAVTATSATTVETAVANTNTSVKETTEAALNISETIREAQSGAAESAAQISASTTAASSTIGNALASIGRGIGSVFSSIASGISGLFGEGKAGTVGADGSYGGFGGVTGGSDTLGIAGEYADGGLARGLSLVGEQGPELIDFKTPTRVYSNRASNDLLSNQDLIAEIRNLHKEIAQLRMEQRQHTGNLIAANYDANSRNADAIVEGNQKSLVNENWKTRNAVKVA